MDIVKQQKQQIINLLKQGRTLSEISIEVFHTTSTAPINMFIYQNEIEPYKYNDIYLFMNKDWLKEQILKYKTPSKISSVFNMPRTSVTRYAERFNLYNVKFNRLNKNYIDEDYFKNIDSDRKAYWLGFIMADGSIYHFKKVDRVQFALKIKSTDKDLLVKFAKDIKFDPEKIKDRKSLRKETITYSSTLLTGNKVFCNNLINNYIVDKKGGHEVIPDTVPDEYIKDFIRGFCDGNGTIGLPEHKNISVCSMSTIIIRQFHNYFNKNNIITYMHHKKMKSGKTLYNISISTKYINEFKDLIYYDNCLCLERKMNRLIKLIK